MSSPFRNNKKQRRRGRKGAVQLREGAAKWEETQPETASAFRRMADTFGEIANAKRRKKSPKS
jgi:hypothetical protein